MYINEIKKQWALKESIFDESLVALIIDKYKLSRPIAELICERAGNNENLINSYINKDVCELFDPYLLCDMDKAVERIMQAVDNKNDIIAVYGDYDVDGITSVSLLYLYLTSLGLRVGYYIPSRNDEGYGINRAAVNKLHSKGVTLIISVDTGVTAIDEVKYAKSLGIDVVVTDHHECRQELPDAVAVINPHRPDCGSPFKDLAGVGVAFKLVCAVEIARCVQSGMTEYEAQRRALIEYGDLVAIGTIADVMPIISENRTIVSMGLKIIEARPRLGVAALMDASSNKMSYSSAKKELSTSYIGFTLAPRLNAAGRMGNAAIAVELLLAEDEDTAMNIAVELCETNRLRQMEENRIVDAALEKIDDEWDLHIKNGGVVVLADDDWQQGVIGIVASRITERFGLPAVLVSFEGSVPLGCDESPVDLGKGSGRSIKGFNLVNALSECSDLLEKYGGHELAAGLSLRRGNLDAFREKLNDYARPIIDSLDRVQVLEADRQLCSNELTLALAQDITQIVEPCGQGNPLPTFVMTDLVVTSVRGIGAGKHLKFTFEKDGRSFTGLYFGVAESQNSFAFSDHVDIMFTVGLNHFKGNTELQLIISDMRYADAIYIERRNLRDRLFAVMNGARFAREDDYFPSRRDFVVLYRFIEKYISNGTSSISDSTAEKLFREMLPPDEIPNFVKYRLMLAIFNELDIFKIEYIPLTSDSNGNRWHLPEDISVIVRGSAEKVDLESSELLLKLKQQMID